MTRTLAASGAMLLVTLLPSCAPTRYPPGGNPNQCTTSHGVCFLDVAVPSGCTQGSCVSVDPDPMYVKGARDVNLLWRLPKGYAFCKGDGIAFKDGPGDQFTDGYATDDPRGGKGSGRAGPPNFHWKDANSAKGTFPYTVRFHAAGCAGAAIEKDPDVVNEM